jgi:hypothetical protein
VYENSADSAEPLRSAEVEGRATSAQDGEKAFGYVTSEDSRLKHRPSVDGAALLFVGTKLSVAGAPNQPNLRTRTR